MTASAHICHEQDCAYPTNRPDHHLCYDHYLESTDGAISLCPNCRFAYKPTEYPICRDCYGERRSGERQPGDHVGGMGWEEPPAQTAYTPSSAVRAVEFVRRNMREFETACNNHESNTTQYLVDPILQGLRWNTSDPSQVQKEYYPERRRRYRRSIRVDIALLRNGNPVAFIEVKRLDRNFSQEYQSQLEDYASYLGNGIAILTNGRFWQVQDVTNGVATHSATIDIWKDSADSVAERLSRLLGNISAASVNQPTRSAPRVARQHRRTPTGEQITDALKEYRGREAQRRRRPAYTIFNDETIAQIAAVKPANYNELQSVKGVGPTTVKQHGAAILKIVAG